MLMTILFIIARSWKEPRFPSTEEQIQKLWYIYTMEYYSDIKNNEFMKFIGKWMNLECIILSELTPSQNNTHDMHSLISGYQSRSPEAPNTHDAIHKAHETRDEGRPQCGYFDPLQKGEQNTHGRSYRDKVQSRD